MEVNGIQNLTDTSLLLLNDESQQAAKLKPLELLKMKICKSHDLIMNYNDKIKECTSLKTSLKQAQVESEKMKTNYNNTLSKNIKLELQNTKFRKSLEDSTKKIADLETKIAGDQRLIQQLTCKIEDNVKNEEKIKNLEQEIKILKRTLPNKKKATRSQGVNTDDVEIVDFDSNLSAEAKLLENRLQGSEFDESVEVKEKRSSSLLCTKCEAAFEKMIATVESPKPLISPLLSPNPYLYPNSDQNHTEPVYSPMRSRAVVEPENLTDLPKEKNPASETMETLEKRLKNLERKIKKQNKIEDKNRCCHSNQDIMLEIWKKLIDRDKSFTKRKCKKKLKRCKSKRKEISKKKGKRKTLQNWSVESAPGYANAGVSTISKDGTSICEPDNLRPENSVILSPAEKIILSTEENPKVKIGESYLEQDRSKSVIISESSKNEKQTSAINVNHDFEMLEVSHDKISASSPNNEPPKVQEKDVFSKDHRKKINVTKENDFDMLKVSYDKIFASSPNDELPKVQEKDVVFKEPSILQKEISNTAESILSQENQTNVTKESTFEMMEVRSDEISASSPNYEPPKVQEKDVVLKEPSTLQKEISDPTESILNPEKPTVKEINYDMMEVSQDKISLSSPNTEALFIQEKDLVSKQSPTLPKVITEPEESVLTLEKLKENSTNTNDEISAHSPNIIETPKILGFHKDTPKEVVNQSSTSAESRRIVVNRIQSVKRKVSSPEENLDSINNSSVLGEHSRKMVRRRLASHYSTDSLDIYPIENSSDFQSLHLNKTCFQILVTNSEEGKVNETPEEIFETDESSITDKVQILETISSFEISERLESTEDISQEVTNSFSGKRKSVLQDDLALSDDEPPEEIKSKSSSSLEDASDIFISNRINKNLSKNFIQGKRSSDRLLTIISPVNQKKRKKKIETVKNSKPGSRGTLLSKIRTLKRRTNKIVSTPMIQQSEKLKIQVPIPEVEKVNPDDSVALNSLDPYKKRRIAHTPKVESESGSVTSSEEPIRKSLRSAKKSPEKVKNSRVKSSEQKLINLEVKEEKPPAKKKGRPKKVKSIEVNLEVDLDTDYSQEVNLPNEVETTEESLRIADLNQSVAEENDSTSMKNASSQEEVALSSRIGMENEYWKNANKVLESCKETEENDAGSSRELRSRTQEVRFNFLPVHRRDPILQTHYVIKLLNENFEAKSSVSFSRKSKLSQTSLEKNVKQQIVRLINSESWTMELHADVTEKISGLCNPSTAAKCIVSFLQEKFLEDEEPLDKTYTPPAPMMSRTQQKIVTLITSLEKLMPNIVDLVTAGIDFSLFRLSTDYKDKKVVEGLARVYTALVRLKKDREKARLFCCDALYSLRNIGINVIFVVLSCWPEVFPICDTNPEILPKCMAHIILTSEGCGYKNPRVNALKNLITAYYRYPRAEYFSKHLVVEFLSALSQKHESSTDMAIILLAKKEGPDWTYKNIIQGGLLQMIVERTHPSVYDAFNLLGNLMRTFPKEDEENYIGKIVQQLCDLLDSGQGTEDHLEGVATALLSLSMFTKYSNKVAKSLLLWKPKEILRKETLTKFKFFFQGHSVVAWHEFIKHDFTVLTEPRKKNVQKKMTRLNTTQVQTKKKKNKRQAKNANTSGKVPSNS